MSLANNLGKAADAASQIHGALQSYTTGIALMKGDVEKIADPELRQKLLNTIEELSHATTEVTTNVSALANSLAEMDEVVSGSKKSATLSPPPDADDTNDKPEDTAQDKANDSGSKPLTQPPPADDHEPEPETVAKPPVSTPPPDDNGQDEVNPCDVVTAEAPPVEPTETAPPSTVTDKAGADTTNGDKPVDTTEADQDPDKVPQIEPPVELPPVTDKPKDTAPDKANDSGNKPPTDPPPAA
jgi:hypothetical protein